jgi:hypothetical protein
MTKKVRRPTQAQLMDVSREVLGRYTDPEMISLKGHVLVEAALTHLLCARLAGPGGRGFESRHPLQSATDRLPSTQFQPGSTCVHSDTSRNPDLRDRAWVLRWPTVPP